MNLVISGSRHVDIKHYTKYEKMIDEYISNYGTPDIIIAGGAEGIDKIAEMYAENKGIEILVIEAQWYVNGIYDKSAGPKRNRKMIKKGTHLLAFPLEEDYVNKKGGTYNTIKQAKRAKLTVEIIPIKIE